MVSLVLLCLSANAQAARSPTTPRPVHRQLTKPAKGRQTSAVKLSPMPYVGDSENRILSNNPLESRALANLGQSAGFNLWRINVYFQLPSDTDSHNNIPTDPQQLCNAAEALVGAGIRNLMLTFMPTANTGYPQSQTDLDDLNKAIDVYLGVLYGTAPLVGCADRPDGQPALNLMVQPGNEMNIDTFCQPQNDDDHLACAQMAVLMQASVYTFIKGLEMTKFGAPITVIGASVASHHTPYLYLSQYQHKMAVLTHCVCMDVFDFHPYAQWGSCDQMSGFNMYKGLMVNGRATFGKIFGSSKLPIFYGEWAVQTQESTSEGYQGTEPWNCQVVPENQQLAIWTPAIAAAEQQHVLGVVTEHLCDERRLDIGFQSGLWNYRCDRAKPGQPAISQLIRSAHL